MRWRLGSGGSVSTLVSGTGLQPSHHLCPKELRSNESNTLASMSSGASWAASFGPLYSRSRYRHYPKAMRYPIARSHVLLCILALALPDTKNTCKDGSCHELGSCAQLPASSMSSTRKHLCGWELATPHSLGNPNTGFCLS